MTNSTVVIINEDGEEEANCMNCNIDVSPDHCDKCGRDTFRMFNVEVDDYENIQGNGAPERLLLELCDVCNQTIRKDSRFEIMN